MPDRGKGVSQSMKAKKLGRAAIKGANQVVNLIVLTVILLLIAYAVYALWDSHQIYRMANSANYAIYKPTVENQGKSFKELQAINGDVFAWLSVYGTNIDYPVTQGRNNMEYVNTSAEGRYSLSGAIFLDCRNSKNFTDFNSILYGHHMEKKAMFGEIGTFVDKDVFDSHRYGNLYFNGQDHGIEFFAFVHTDAYDSSVFSAGVTGEEAQRAYLENLSAKAIHERDIGVTIDDHIVLLSTCSSSSTNGRDILVGRISDETFEDTLINTETNNGNGQLDTDALSGYSKEIPLLALLLILISAVWLIVNILVIDNRRRQRKSIQKRPTGNKRGANS